MREISLYAGREWLEMLPLSDAFKQLRNDIWLRNYVHQSVNGVDAFLTRCAGFDKGLGLVVAFEQPWALDWQLQMARQNISDMQLVVFDNSRNTDMRARIAQVCAAHDVPYLGLPENPTRHVNRSHGFAMNWAYHNVVKAIKPVSFAFIDHDMIPVLPSSCFKSLRKQPVYGLINASDWAWQLWAGYCAFDYAHVAGRDLNFLYDFSNGLDTGGRNWKPVYSHLKREQLAFANREFWDVVDPYSGGQASVEMVDDTWFHIGNISYNDVFKQKAELCQNLAKALASGRDWLSLRASAA
ncbi:hypothetical protein [Chromobacterium alticapitis]|uniref:Uncharacterized protein n=1 Tax=Chromobacterium alticapitis TaxID=2073169 RepID=A0A2S5DCD7_9NEIS|nr:hypothetical protein [Chromobacterium alticapitis]POZ60745.1 hypothetical protein C2I19_17275 [Chromobacterium alticapitis]